MPKIGVSGDISAGAARQPRTIRGLRWYICGLLFFATTINYIDRQVIGILKPVLDRELHISQAEFGLVLFGFQLAYAVLMPFAGRMIDAVGTRLGYSVAVLVWSVAAMAHAAAGSAFQFGIARFFLGIGESANFPAALRTVADWFPRRERALATGIFNSGSNLGALIAPLLVPFVAVRFGWHSAFLFTGALGLLWFVCWLLVYRQPEQHASISADELALITSERDTDTQVRIPWRRLLTKKATWAFLIGKMFTDPVWWFYLYWTPDFLHRKYGLNIAEIGPPLVVIYLLSDAGSIGGGWLSSFLLKRGWTAASARKTTMLLCALAVLSAVFVPYTSGNLWLAVILIAIAASAHQGWSANVYTIPSDIFPRSAVGSLIGLGGFGGALMGMFAAPAIGIWLSWSHDRYGPLFIAAGLAYLFALGIVHLLLPTFEPVNA